MNYFLLAQATEGTETITAKDVINDPSIIMDFLDKGKQYLIDNGPDMATKIISAILIFIIGKFVAKLITSFLHKALQKSKIDETLSIFLRNLSYSTLMVVVIIIALDALGVETTSFVAVLGAAGLAIGLALQGSLSNFAAGVLIILLRPFHVGNFVEAGGAKGVVKDIDIFTTTIDTPDNKRMIIPNSKITSDNIINYSTNPTRRVDLVMGISYDDDIKKAKETMAKVLSEEPRVLAEPAFLIAVAELGDSSVNFNVRPWVKADDYWGVYYDLTEKLKLALEDNGITIPFPQRDVHIISENSAS